MAARAASERDADRRAHGRLASARASRAPPSPGPGFASRNIASCTGRSARCARRASSSFPSSARRVARVTSAGSTFDVTLMTPRAPTAIIGSVSASSPQRTTMPVAERLRELLRAERRCPSPPSSPTTFGAASQMRASVSGSEVDARASRDVVDDDREADAPRDLDEVPDEALLRGLVVVRHDDHDGVGARRARRAAPSAIASRVEFEPGARDDLRALGARARPSRSMTSRVLFVRQRRALARRPAGDEAGDAAGDLRVDERVERVPVDRLPGLVAERRDERGVRSFEAACATLARRRQPGHVDRTERAARRRAAARGSCRAGRRRRATPRRRLRCARVSTGARGAAAGARATRIRASA